MSKFIGKMKKYKKKYSEWRENSREKEIERLKKQRVMLTERKEVEKLRTEIARTKAARPTSGFKQRMVKGFGTMGRDISRGMVFRAPPRTDMWGSVIKEPMAVTKVPGKKRRKKKKK